jgi:transglutaminase-like putative cysteine protease
MLHNPSLDSTDVSIATPLTSNGYSVPADQYRRTVRPIGVYQLRGLSYVGDRLLALDATLGCVIEIDPKTDNTSVINPKQANGFVDATGFCVAEDRLWFSKGHAVYWCNMVDFVPQHFLNCPYHIESVAVLQSTLYITCRAANAIMVYDIDSGRRITNFPAPGIGEENLTVRGEELWICDRLEQTVYCMDRATGEVMFSVLTPFDSPTAIAFHPDAELNLCYVAYATEERYIRDNPNADPQYELTTRDLTFLHPLHFLYDPAKPYVLSNGYLIEMSYVEEISVLDEIHLGQVEWRIALPAETPRQTIRQVEPIGLPFTEEVQEGQRVAVFRIDAIDAQDVRLFGWKALIEVRGIKYRLAPRDFEKVPELSPEFQARYLIDDDELSMSTWIIQEAARESVGRETNLLRKVLTIRNYVYDRLSYGIKPHIDTPDVVIRRGTGSCGEYVGLLLALLRLNGIACRTVGRYKCPSRPDIQRLPLQPDFNHVWIEFYVPGVGWVPMESNVDDVIEGGPYPTRFFMGLPWYHAEIAKGISFEKVFSPDMTEETKIGQIAINHIRFTILEELPPPTIAQN